MIEHTPPMTREEEPDLIARAKAGDEQAAARIVTSLIGCVYNDIKRWGNGTWEDREDMAQRAYMAILHAIDKFEPERGLRFSTYAGHWWRQAIRVEGRMQQAQGRGGAQSIMVGRYSAYNRHMDAAMEASDPAEYLAHQVGTKREFAQAFIDLKQRISSLDSPPRMGDDRSWADMLEDEGDTPERSLERKRAVEAVDSALSSMKPRYAEVIRWRFLGRRQMTLDAIGKRYKVTCERARQIEALALADLRKKLTLAKVA